MCVNKFAMHEGGITGSARILVRIRWFEYPLTYEEWLSNTVIRIPLQSPSLSNEICNPWCILIQALITHIKHITPQVLAFLQVMICKVRDQSRLSTPDLSHFRWP